MTEIPEHLLKRSRERRQATGAGGDAGGDDKPAAAAPAKTEGAAPAAPATTAPAGRAAAPAPAEPEPPKPDSPVVAAYKQRRRIPFWAMAALSILPIWAFMYARAVTQSEQEAAGPIGIGAEIYGGNCASCHGAAGGGGSGYAFTGGSVLETYPHIEDQLRYVYYGTSGYNLAGVEIPGNPERDGGPHVTGALGPMPQQGSSVGGSLTDYEVLGVVCHERYTLGGADPDGDYAEEFETWCSEESEIFVDLESGGNLQDLEMRFEGIDPIGFEPVPGSPPSE